MIVCMFHEEWSLANTHTPRVRVRLWGISEQQGSKISAHVCFILTHAFGQQTETKLTVVLKLPHILVNLTFKPLETHLCMYQFRKYKNSTIIVWVVCLWAKHRIPPGLYLTRCSDLPVEEVKSKENFPTAATKLSRHRCWIFILSWSCWPNLKADRQHQKWRKHNRDRTRSSSIIHGWMS